MGLVATDYNLQHTLQTDINTYFNSGTFVLHLYQNNHTPIPADTPAAFTEATFSGYSSISLGMGEFSSPVQVISGQWETTGSLHVFTSTDATPQTIYGYYLTDGGGNLWWAELFAGPVVLVLGGASLAITLHYDRWARSILPP